MELNIHDVLDTMLTVYVSGWETNNVFIKCSFAFHLSMIPARSRPQSGNKLEWSVTNKSIILFTFAGPPLDRRIRRFCHGCASLIARLSERLREMYLKKATGKVCNSNFERRFSKTISSLGELWHPHLMNNWLFEPVNIESLFRRETNYATFTVHERQSFDESRRISMDSERAALSLPCTSFSSNLLLRIILRTSVMTGQDL